MKTQMISETPSGLNDNAITSRLTASLMLIAVVLFLFVVFTSAVNAREIRVGVVNDQSSINSELTRDYMAGARTYFDFINSQGGINGQRIAIVSYNDEGSPAKTVAATRELIERDRVTALFGFVGDETVAAIAADPFFKQAGVALYAPLSGVGQTNGPDNIFFVRPTYRNEARYIINHFNGLGTTEYMIVHTNDKFGKGLSKEIVDELNTANARGIYNVPIPEDEKSIENMAKRILSSRIRVVIVAADTIGTAEFVRQYRRYDKGTNVVAFSIVNPRTLLELATPDHAASTMITQVVPDPLLPQTQVQAEHLKLFQKFRDEPPSHVTLEGFIAAKSFVASLRRSGAITRTSVLASMRGSQRVDVGGITLNFTPANDRGSTFVDLAFLRKSGRLIQ
jgi:branched-chain amino acid transport system substrate-binding protein